MHNRNEIWHTKDGRSLKLRDISSMHLENILNYIERDKVRLNKYKNNFLIDLKQEIRLRKLNRLSNDDSNLF